MKFYNPNEAFNNIFAAWKIKNFISSANELMVIEIFCTSLVKIQMNKNTLPKKPFFNVVSQSIKNK